MPERLNFKLGIIGEQKKNVVKVFTFKNFLSWLNQQSYSEEIKAKILEKARGYPVGALPNFIQNINTYLRGIQHNG